jgi:hypothetical protein
MIFMTIYSLLAIAFFIYNLRCHMKAKEFFWTELPDSQKESVNYIGYKKVLFAEDLPHAKKLCDFLNERNTCLREVNPSMAEKLIKAEKHLCIGEILLLPVFLFWAMQIFKVIQ